MRLKNCIDIIAGYPSGKFSDEPDECAYSVVSASNLMDNNLYIMTNELNKVYSTYSLKELEPSDILLTNRNRILSAVVPKQEFHKLIAKDFISIIRITKYFKDDILPEYLAIQLRSDKIRREMLKNSTTSVRSIVIPNSAVLNIEIDFPNIKKQQEIVICYNKINRIKQNYAHKIELLTGLQKGIS
ncbi:MAG: restriction endonuclease subunit S [Candidatus Ancillula sp.]|nr:restriction endonuclease subunit S [Candidatus Ancillula sp.]